MLLVAWKEEKEIDGDFREGNVTKNNEEKKNKLLMADDVALH